MNYTKDLTDQQAASLQMLSLLGPAPAAFFRDACLIFNNESTLDLHTFTHLLGHCMREIESSLRAVLLPSNYVAPKSGDKHKPEIEAILQAYGIPPQGHLAELWLSLADVASKYRLHALAHRRNQLPPRPADEDFRKFFETFSDTIFQILKIFEPKYAEKLRELDLLASKQQPGKADKTALQNNHLNNFSATRHFFNKAQSPLWLTLLADTPYFTEVQGGPYETDPESGQTLYPLWPQGTFLSRMLAQIPDEAIKVVLALNTDNLLIIEDLVRGLPGMPNEAFPALRDEVLRWASLVSPEQNRFLLSEMLEAFVKHQDTTGALQVAERIVQVKALKEGHRLLTSVVDAWWVNHLLSDTLGPIREQAPGVYFDFVLKVLQQALDDLHTLRGGTEKASIHQRTIVPHEQSLGQGLQDHLVQAVLTGARLSLENHPEEGSRVLKSLLQSAHPLLERIGLQVLRDHPAGKQDLIEAALTDAKHYDRADCRYEMIHLLEEQFALMSEDVQRRVLEILEQLPVPEHLQDPNEAAHFLLRRQQSWLQVIKPHLSEHWTDVLQEANKQFGVQEHPDFLFYHYSVFGPGQTPISKTEMVNMTNPELLQFLMAWKGPVVAKFDEPNQEALAQELQQMVAENPQRYVVDAPRFLEMPTSYTHAFLIGVWDSLRNGKSIEDWTPLLTLFQGILDRQASEQPKSTSEFNTRSWNDTVRSVARILERALQQENHSLLQESATVLDVLARLLNTPDPEERPENFTDRPHMDYVINNTRPLALSAVIFLGCQTKKQMQQQEPGWQVTLNDLPAIEHLLTERLLEPQPGIHTAYGGYLHLLERLDWGWVVKHQSEIFPTERPDIWLSTFETYLEGPRFSEQHLTELNIYPQGLEHLLAGQLTEHAAEALLDRLAQFILHGVLNAEAPLMQRFYASGSVEQKAKLLECIGRRTTGSEDPGFASTATQYWERRVQEVEDGRAAAGELNSVELWCRSPHISPRWKLQQLKQVIPLLGGSLEWFDVQGILRTLQKLQSSEPKETMETLQVLLPHIDLDAMTRMSLREVLLVGVHQAESESLARTLINELAMQGWSDIISVLP